MHNSRYRLVDYKTSRHLHLKDKNYLKSIALNFNIKQNWATPLTIQLNAYRCGLSKLSSPIHVDEMVVIVCHPDHDGVTCLPIDFVDNVDLKLQGFIYLFILYLFLLSLTL